MSSAQGGGNSALMARIRAYTVLDNRRAAIQVLNTLPLFVLSWYLAYRAMELSYVLTLLLAIPTAGFVLRTWLLQHDCGHGAFFMSQRVNDVLGSLCGIVTLLPYHHWRRIHGIHHEHHGDLDRRGPGYITTLTVAEYHALSPWRRFVYRMYRNPLLLLIPGALYYFVLQQRFPYDAERSWRVERWSVYLTDVALVGVVVAVAGVIGPGAFFMVHVPVICVSSTVGAWIFLNQHSYEHSYWERHGEWDFVRSALAGSSYYQLPRILNWFTASVGFHHVHHLSPRIPNYHLERCHHEVPELRVVPPLTIRRSLGTAHLALWDERTRRMVSFREASSVSDAAR